MKTDITFSEWKKALEDLSLDQIDPIPKGWITAVDFAEKLKQSCTNARLQLNMLVSSGRAEKKKFKIQSGEVIRQVSHYRLKK